MVKYVGRCDRCGWRYGFHICLDLPEHIMKRVEAVSKPKQRRAQRRDPRSDAYRGSDEWRANISAGMQNYAAQCRAENTERDANIVRGYVEDEHTIVELAAIFNVSYPTIADVLHRARDAGELDMRPASVRVRS